FDNWFSTQSQRVVDTSLAMARAYATREVDQLQFDIGAVRDAITQNPALMKDDPIGFRQLLTSTATAHQLTHVFLVTSSGQLVVPADKADVRQVPPPSTDAMAQAAQQPTQILVQPPQDSNALIGITGLQGFDDLYIYAARLLDQQVL